MKNLTPIASAAFLLFAVTLSAQEIDEQSAEADPIADEVFADDLVAPEQQEPAKDLVAEELPDQLEPTLDQVVPVADDTREDSVEQAAAEQPEDFAPSELVTVPLPADATAEEKLFWNYERYKQLVEDGVYDEADSVAKRVVELAIEVKGADSVDFAKALTNLAIVQHRTKQFDAAQQNFQSAIEIIEEKEDRLNEHLVNPLSGLGASQLEGGRPDLAGDTFRRAVHVTHVNEGPHNLNQISILESIAEADLRLGDVEEAKHVQDTIFALNQRAHASNSLDMVAPLIRRASWQHRAGFINDERTTLRQVIRIVEVQASKDDLRLVEPLTQLGRSYFYVDSSGSQSFQSGGLTTGEIYFKRALRIASENPAAHWELVANASLALGDYYIFEGTSQRAHKVYKDTWMMLTEDDERLGYRQSHLEQFVPLRVQPIPQYIENPDPDATAASDPDAPLLQGNITIAYDISVRGRATNLKIVEAAPADFTSMLRSVQREIRSRIYRPQFVDAQPAIADEQLLIHKFFYRQADLDAIQNAAAAAEQDKT